LETTLGEDDLLAAEKLGECLVALFDGYRDVGEFGSISLLAVHGDPFGNFSGIDRGDVLVVECPVDFEEEVAAVFDGPMWVQGFTVSGLAFGFEGVQDEVANFRHVVAGQVCVSPA